MALAPGNRTDQSPVPPTSPPACWHAILSERDGRRRLRNQARGAPGGYRVGMAFNSSVPALLGTRCRFVRITNL
jgi:hypothetical protein